MTRFVVDCRMAFSSGIGTHLRALLPRVAARLKPCEVVALARPRDFERLAALAPLELVPCDAGVYAPLEQLKLLRAVPRGSDVFWAPHINIPVAFRGRLVVTVHDLFPFALGRALGTRLDKLLHTRALLRAVRLRAHHVVTVSEFTRRELVRWLGPARQPISVVPNGVEAAWFARDAGSRPYAEPYVLYVGNLKPHKNIPRLVQAFARIAADMPHRLVLLGQRDGFSDRRADELAGIPAALRERIVFTGRVSEPSLVSHVAHADGLVLPSVYEGFGLPPLEAMAREVPVLVGRAGALPEVCSEAALYCDPLSVADMAAKLRLLLGEPALRARLRARGLERARLFDWERSAERMAAILRGD